MATVRRRIWASPEGEEKSAWIVTYIERGKRRQKTFALKKQADAFRVKKEGEIARGEIALDGATVASAAEQYLRFQELRMRDGLIGRGHWVVLKRHVDLYIKPILGRLLFSEIEPADVERWLRAISARGLSPSTVIDVRATLRRLERYARRRNYAKHLVMAETLAEFGTPEVRPIRTFSAEDISRILKAAALRGTWGRVPIRGEAVAECFVHLATFCGLRFGEIAALTEEHLTGLEQGIIHVRASVTPFGEFKGPKTAAGVRDVPAPRHVAELLSRYRQAYATPNQHGLIFLNADNDGPVSHTTIRRQWCRILYLAGIIGREHGPPRLAATVWAESSKNCLVGVAARRIFTRCGTSVHPKRSPSECRSRTWQASWVIPRST